METISDQKLLKLVKAADDECLAEGLPPKRRSITVPMRVMNKLSLTGYVLAGPNASPIFTRAADMLETLYRPSDLQMGGLHMGVIMFRDIFAKVEVPFAFGTVHIEPLDMTDLNDAQKAWLSQSSNEFASFFDQFTDIFDFGFGYSDVGESHSLSEKCRAYMMLTHFHLQAAAAIVTGAYDFRGAIQSSLLATELILKSALAARGCAEKKLRDFSHNTVAIVNELEKLGCKLDFDRVKQTLSGFPRFVQNRYSVEQPNRMETGFVIMGAQYIAAEIMRQLSSRNFRKLSALNTLRVFPPLQTASEDI